MDVPPRADSRPAPGTDTPARGGTSSALVVTARDEAPDERNAFKPRIAFRNMGARTIRAFRATWDIPGRTDRAALAEAYYAPGCTASLASRPGGLRLTISCEGIDLAPGRTHPGADGIALGLHYQDWSPWGEKPALGRDFATRNDIRTDIAQ